MSDIKVKHKLDWGSDVNVLINDMCNHANTHTEEADLDDGYDDSIRSTIEVCDGLYCQAWREINHEDWIGEALVDPEDAPKPRKTNGILVSR